MFDSVSILVIGCVGSESVIVSDIVGNKLLRLLDS